MKEISICSSGEQAVRASQLRGSERDLKIPAGTSRLSLRDWLTELERNWCFGKMSQGYYQVTAERILPPSCRCCAAGKSKFPSPEKVKEKSSGDGGIPASSRPPPEDTDWLGELWTLSLCEWNQDFAGPSRKDEGVCSLSEVLVIGNVPRRYYLSRDASAGILNRAARRGKELPADLKSALLAAAGQT